SSGRELEEQPSFREENDGTEEQLGDVEQELQFEEPGMTMDSTDDASQEFEATHDVTQPATPLQESSTLIPGTFPPSPTLALRALPAEEVPSKSSPSDVPMSPVKLETRVASIGSTIRRPRSLIDIALAMQLRPGLGAGADPAWM
ncbi:hypothetical protein H0H93_003576, partial [Arthromyces matolae]